MKSLITSTLLLLLTLTASASTTTFPTLKKLEGQWQVDKTFFTFTSDSLYIDEIDSEGGAEGDCYHITKIDGDTITIKSDTPFGDTIHIVIKSITEKAIKLFYVEEPEQPMFTIYKRKNPYKFDYCYEQ